MSAGSGKPRGHHCTLAAQQEPLLLLPSLGNMQKHFGAGYVAPQERLGAPQWDAQYQSGSVFVAELSARTASKAKGVAPYPSMANNDTVTGKQG